MRHPTEGLLRRLLDEPAAVTDADRQHVAACDECLAAVAGIRRDAELVHAALVAGTDADVDVSAAWQRLSAATPVGAPARSIARASVARGGRLGAALRRPVVAAVAVAVVLAGAGTAAANDWLPIFRTERVEAISLSAADLNTLPDLSAYGDVAFSGEPRVHPVADAAAAAAESGLEVPVVVRLPRGVFGEPTYQVGAQVTATFTFSADRASRAAAKAGEALPALPPGLDGSKVRLVAGPGLAEIWSSQQSGVPALVVGRAVAPTAQSSGLPFETVRDYLLALPGLPEHLAAQLRTFNADSSTLPLPVPVEHITASPATVAGIPATVLTTRDRSLAAVVWVDDGVVSVVAGAVGRDEVLSVAQGLR